MPNVLDDEIFVDRPPAAVFAFMSDHENLPLWTVGVLRSRRTNDGGPGLGATYALRGKAPGGEVNASYRVTAWNPPRSFEGRCESRVFEFNETYTFEPAGDGTRVRLHVVMRPKGIFRLLGFVLRFAFARQIRQDHVKVKALVEGASVA
jgi:uncharacterized protein YndB with AHSA1/START domain